MGFKATLNRYYQFSKPGIVYANVLTALAGYLFASQLHLQSATLLGLLGGLGMLIIGACAANNCIDRRRDATMKRTAQRSLVQGTLPLQAAIGYAAALSIAGMGLLVYSQNTLTAILTAVAYLDYVVLYGIAKRTTVHGTLVGCVSGALPLVAGYTAVTNQLDITALLLFGLMVVWQMAHFFGIALYRLEDYTAAGLPVMPVRRGASATKPQIVLYICLFVIFTILLMVQSEFGILAGLILAAMGVFWLYRAIKNYANPLTAQWGKQVFVTSLGVMLTMVGCLSLGSVLI
jgi:protoheme IX farnesyltransferase